MNRKTKWIIGALTTLALLPLMWRGIEAFDYANSDAITRTAVDTGRVLARYERSGDASEIRELMVNPPGDAVTTQRDLTLGRWAQENPAEFAAIIDGMTEQERDILFETFFSNLAQGGLDKASFAAAFRPHNSPAVAQMIRHLNETIMPQKW